VRSFRFGKYTLPCGSRSHGYRHIARKHGPINWKAYGCIQAVLSKAKPMHLAKEDKLIFEWAFARGDFARVVVRESSGNIITAYTKGAPGPETARWSDCIARG